MTGSRAIEIVAPADMQAVSLPVRLAWVGDLAAGEAFAVFLNSDPIAPRRNFRWLAEDVEDHLCLSRPDCPDEAWLGDRGIYVTTAQDLTVDRFPVRRGAVGRDEALQYVSVIRVDVSGNRVDEAGDRAELVLAEG